MAFSKSDFVGVPDSVRTERYRELARVLSERLPGVRTAQVDKFEIGDAIDYTKRLTDIGFSQIRGREQNDMDYFGGAQSDTKPLIRTHNAIRGIRRTNPRYGAYMKAAADRYGLRAPGAGYGTTPRRP